jgi:hypothetical protein
MTQKEIKDKIADWENRLKNPSVAGVPSAVTKINSEIAKLEAMLEKEEKPKAEKKGKVTKSEGVIPKYKIGDYVKVVYGEENGKSGLITKVYSHKLYPQSVKVDATPYYEIEGTSKDISENNLELLKEPKKELSKDKLKEIRAEYQENENDNAHSENTVLLAKYFGTKAELEKANDILEKHNKLGSIPESLNDERHELNKKLYKKFVDLEGKGTKHEDKETKAEPSPKYKVGDILWHDTKYKGEYKKVKILAVTGWTGDGHRYDVEFVDDNNKGINKFARSYDEDLSKTEPKKDAYDCDDLVKEAKERHAKAKKAAQARAEAPKKSEATKDKEKIEKVHDTVEKQLEKGKLNKSQLQKLIAETKDLLKLLEKALKDL